MSEEKRIYEHILATLESKSDEINKAFLDRAGDAEIIDLAHIGDLINDLSIIFNTDLEEAKDFISYDNDNVSKYFDLDNINFTDFVELVKMWLQSKTGQVQSRTAINQEEEGDDKNVSDKQIRENDGNYTERQNEQSDNNTLIPPNTYRVNRETLDELLMRHKAHLQVKFYQLRHPDIEAIALKDYFNFLQDCFSLDGLVLYENPSDTQDLFTRDDYQEKLTQIVDKYHDEVKGTSISDSRHCSNLKTGHTIDGEEELLLTFNECFDIIDYWFQTDENVALVNPKKKASALVNQSTDGQSHVKDLLLETIEKYQEMIKEASTEVEKQILQGTIETLYEKLNKLEAGPKDQDNESRLLQEAKIQKKKEEKRMRALRDIFDFYSKQQLNAGKAPTFDRIEKQFSSINLGKLSVIIKNFSMKIDQFKLKETFKKVAKSEFVTFEEFCDLFQKVSKDAELIKDPKIVKPNYEKMKEYKPDSYKTSPVPKSLGKLDFKKKDESERRKTDKQKIEEMWDHMGLYNGSYKNNLNTVQLAFNSHDKETFRIGPEGSNYKLKIRGLEGKTPEEIKEAIFQRNEMRKAVRDVKLIEKSLLKNYRDPSTGKQTSRRDHSISERREETYATIMANKPRGNLPEKKLTLNQVQKYKQNEIKTIGAEDRFDPRDLIDDNDDEDNMYLAEYNIINDATITEQPIQETAENFEETVKLETNIRKARQIPGKYSRVPTKSKTRVGTGPHHLAEIHTEKKPMTLNDIDYKSPMPNTASSNHTEFKRPQLGVSQSVKANLGVSKHLASIHEYSSKNLDQSHHTVTKSIQIPTGMGMPYEYSQFDPRRAAGNVVLSRAYQIQEEALRKENAMMANLLSMQNNKIEKGLRVARK